MIKNGQVVTITYLLKNEEGEILDSADVNNPFSYLHGSGQIVTGLESALHGSKVGDKKIVVVEPKDGYGDFDDKLQFTLKKTDFPKDLTVEEGMQFVADNGQGQKMVLTVVEIEGASVHVDGNHPLAGETLHFEVEILNVRDASPEEVQHGHAHVPGQSHHGGHRDN